MKRAFPLFFALFLCLSLFACGKQQPTQVPEPDPNVITCYPAPEDTPSDPPAQTPVAPPEEPVPADPLPGEQVAPDIPEVILGNYSGIFGDSSGDIVFVRVDANLPHMEALPQIHDYYQTLWEDLKATYALNREDATRHKAHMEAMGQEFIPWTVEITFDVTRNDGVTLSVVREIHETLGGDPTITYQCETFDVATQGRLLLGDLFQPGADYQSFWTDTGELEQLNFAITDDTVVVCGENGGAVPLSDLSDILLPQYVTE